MEEPHHIRPGDYVWEIDSPHSGVVLRQGPQPEEWWILLQDGVQILCLEENLRRRSQKPNEH